MTGRIVLCLAAVLLCGCCSSQSWQTMPELVRIPGENPPPRQCTTIFPTGQWQFVHTIAFDMAHGGGTVLGVLVLNGPEIRCALVSVEGLTLFAARSMGTETPAVSRAIPPFDNPEFAGGLMGDIRTIFQAPPGDAEYGQLADGTPVCRYAGFTVTDILPQENGCWSIATYSERIRTRVIRARSCRMIDSTAIAEELELVAPGPAGYTLNMHLISAERLPGTK